jgi:hypothetical protein
LKQFFQAKEREAKQQLLSLHTVKNRQLQTYAASCQEEPYLPREINRLASFISCNKQGEVVEQMAYKGLKRGEIICIWKKPGTDSHTE